MKNRFTLFLFPILLFLSLAPRLSAGLLLEPLVAYGIGQGDIEGLKSSYTGPLFGGKLGYSQYGLSLGFRYDQGAFTAEEKKGRTADASHRAYGAFIGYDLPALFRASYTYYLSSSQEVDMASGAVDLKGNGYSIQVGFGFAFLINIFVEYQKHSYDNDEKDTAEWYFAGISFPINL